MEQRPRQKTKISESQVGFIPKWSTIEAIVSCGELKKIQREREKSSYGFHRSKESL